MRTLVISDLHLGAHRGTDALRRPGPLAALQEAAAPYAEPGAARPELMPLVIDAVRARASVGEISDAFAAVWGRYRPAA